MEYPPVVYLEDFSVYINAEEESVREMSKNNPNAFFLVYVDKQFPFISTLGFDKEFGYYFSTTRIAYMVKEVKKFYKIPEKV